MAPRVSLIAAPCGMGSWPVPAVMRELARAGRVSPEEMRRTFNLGIGMIVCVGQERAGEARRLLEAEGEQVHDIGRVAAAPEPDHPVAFIGGS